MAPKGRVLVELREQPGWSAAERLQGLWWLWCGEVWVSCREIKGKRERKAGLDTALLGKERILIMYRKELSVRLTRVTPHFRR